MERQRAIGRTVPGAQAVARAAALLRLVSASHDGVALHRLARDAELSRSTTHRLLSALRAEGLVDQDPVSALWLPGPELFPTWLAWFTPLAALWIWGVALLSWRIGVRHYQGGGG